MSTTNTAEDDRLREPLTIINQSSDDFCLVRLRKESSVTSFLIVKADDVLPLKSNAVEVPLI